MPLFFLSFNILLLSIKHVFSSNNLLPFLFQPYIPYQPQKSFLSSWILRKHNPFFLGNIYFFFFRGRQFVCSIHAVTFSLLALTRYQDPFSILFICIRSLFVALRKTYSCVYSLFGFFSCLLPAFRGFFFFSSLYARNTILLAFWDRSVGKVFILEGKIIFFDIFVEKDFFFFLLVLKR